MYCFEYESSLSYEGFMTYEYSFQDILRKIEGKF